ncbi:alpha-amylase family protein [Paenibacillus sp.]|uniref:alpha-amylase family protein n=1 Tax=Paenibacillus sp. TaxID=58172 RepID=UPI002D4956D9|nr:alpha-amylase family protein [Paenibacillus sp.]HZG86700.1 alpha-amylase family protein [Paenibacillus sp.]
MGKADWLEQRSRGVHLTIRDIDVIDFDAERLATDLKAMSVNVLSFFCAGYVTVHPTSLSIRVSPFLGDRDLTGDIVKALHAQDIRAVPAMDLSLIPGNAAELHPDWCSLDRDGHPYKANKDLGNFYIACPLSGYQNEYLSEILREIVTRYDVDGIKFGGGSYGFSSYGNGICYCARCQEAYKEYSGNEVPANDDWNDPNWGVFQRWRQQRVVDRSKFLYDLVKSLRADLPVMCNSVAFGDPGWTTKGALDIERMAQYIDAVQVEAQTRVRVEGDTNHWDFLMMPAEEANFLNTVSDHQPWVLASYFQAWPWRRNAVPPAEQKVYMAQIYANGGNAILNLSGGPPKVHEDQRGFPAVASLYSFVEKNQAYFANDRSAANVALLYSQDTLFYYGRDDAKARYVEAIRGFEQALSDYHIPFDIISDNFVNTGDLSKYAAIVLPSAACMSDSTAEALRAYVSNGGSLVATFETSLFDTDGNKRDEFLLSDLFQAAYQTTESVMGENNGVFKQAYMNIRDASHPLLKTIGDTKVIPASNQFCRVSAKNGGSVPLTLSAAFRVFPEGMSYTQQPDTGHPMAIASEHASGGRTVYFPGQPDTAYLRAGYPDWALLLANAVKWAVNDSLPLQTDAPQTVLTTIRSLQNKQAVHLVNVNGGRRMFAEIIPARDITVTLPATDAFRPKRAYLLSDHVPLALKTDAQTVSVTVPVVIDYDVVVFEA